MLNIVDIRCLHIADHFKYSFHAVYCSGYSYMNSYACNMVSYLGRWLHQYRAMSGRYSLILW